MSQSSTPELLSEMARLTAMSNRISEVQARNLQMFPLVFFNNVSECKIDYDLSHKSDVLEDMDGKLIINAPTRNNYVAYYLVLDEASNQDLDKRFIALEKSVRTLFWNDVAVEIFFNDRIVYKSVRL